MIDNASYNKKKKRILLLIIMSVCKTIPNITPIDWWGRMVFNIYQVISNSTNVYFSVKI